MRNPSIISITINAIPIYRFPHGISQSPVRLIAVEKAIIAVLLVSVSFRYGTTLGKYLFVRDVTGSPERASPASIQERYMIDQIAKVIPAGVIADGNIFDISAWVIPPIRYGEPGILTSEVNPIVIRAIMSTRYFIIL